MIEFETSYPPSLNSYYMKVRNRLVISKKGLAYSEEVKQLTKGMPSFNEDRVSVSVYLYPPDLRRRDIDNILKGIFDSLTKAGIWNDDSQVDKLHVYRMEKIKGGKCLIKIIKIIDKNA